MPEKWKTSTGPRAKNMEDSSRTNSEIEPLLTLSSGKQNKKKKSPAESPSNLISTQTTNRKLIFNTILTKLLAKLPSTDVVDMSHLLVWDKRLRKKPEKSKPFI